MLIYGFQPFMNMFVLSEASVFDENSFKCYNSSKLCRNRKRGFYVCIDGESYALHG